LIEILSFALLIAVLAIFHLRIFARRGREPFFFSAAATGGAE